MISSDLKFFENRKIDIKSERRKNFIRSINLHHVFANCQ